MRLTTIRPLLVLLALSAAVCAGAALAQEATPAPTQLVAPTLPPPETLIFEGPSLDDTPAAPESLSGVGVTAERGNVNVRAEPRVGSAIVGVLRRGRSLDVLGYNGYDLSRTCVGSFSDTLDMWLEVRFAGQPGWVARCAVTITNEAEIGKMIPSGG